jgi:hypothetical protein
MEEGAVLGDEGGFHAGPAYIECDHVLHGGQSPFPRE